MYAAHDENVFFPLGKNVRRSAAQPEKRHLWHFSGKQAEERAKRAISCRVVARVRRSEALAERYRAGCQSKWLLQICIEVCCLGFYNDLTREGYRQQAASSAYSQKKIPTVLSFVSLAPPNPFFAAQKSGSRSPHVRHAKRPSKESLCVAEREGFEPSVPMSTHLFSRQAS